MSEIRRHPPVSKSSIQLCLGKPCRTPIPLAANTRYSPGELHRYHIERLSHVDHEIRSADKYVAPASFMVTMGNYGRSGADIAAI